VNVTANIGGKTQMGWIDTLKRARDEAQKKPATDPWRLPLEHLRGKVWDDGIERVSTQAVFDFLEVPQAARRAGAYRRLAQLMRDLGWVPIKGRGLNQAGFVDQIRGYAREPKRSPLS
jgi:hypothetical protein